MSQQQQWKTRSIFLSSTFQDMHAERDWLRDKVFPELEERLRERFHHLEVIDLRWGVNSSSDSEAEARERQVLDVCLSEIERSRPFLIGLLGQRYGWQPPYELLERTAAEMGFAWLARSASVTDLEICFGVLDHTDRRRRCRFYFREPLDPSTMGPDFAARYDDRFDPAAANTGAAEKLNDLKRRIETALPDRVRQYCCSWDAERRCPNGLEEFGRQVLEDLWSDLDEETAEFLLASKAEQLDQEDLNLAEFVESRSRSFVGRRATIERLLAFRREESGPRRVCVTGPSGIGKSSVFARLHRALQEEDILLLAHAAGIDTTSTRTQSMLRRWIRKLAKHLGDDVVVLEDQKAEEVAEIFERLLSQASRSTEVVLLVDALDQLEDVATIRWLPRIWPDNCQLFCTSRPELNANPVLLQQGMTELPLRPIREEDAREIVHAICAKYHRRPPEPVVEALMSKRDMSGQPAYGNPLWIVLATEELNLLSVDDFALADTEFAHLPVGDRLSQVVQRRADDLAPEIEELFGDMVDRAKKLHGAELTDGVILMTAISIAGWRTRDLAVLVPEVSGIEWDPLRFASLRRSLRGHLVLRGIDERWDFIHRQLREFVLRRQQELGVDLAEAHLIAGDYLFDQPDEDPMKRSAIMRHLIRSEIGFAPGTYLAYHANKGENIQPSLEAVASHLCSFDDEQELKSWFRRFLFESPDESTKCAYIICELIAWHWRTGLFESLRLSSQRALLEVLTEILESLSIGKGDRGKDSNLRSDLAKFMGELAQIDSKIGDAQAAESTARRALEIQQDLGDFRVEELIELHLILGQQLRQRQDQAGAEAEFRAALSMAKKRVDEQRGLDESFRANTAHQVVRAHLSLADALVVTDLAESETHARDVVELARSWSALQPEDARWPHALAAAQEKLGNVHHARGELDQTEGYYRQSLEGLETLSLANPLDETLRQHIAIEGLKLAETLRTLGRHEEALARFLDALAIGDALVSTNPADMHWRSQMAMGRRDIAEILMEMRRFETAVEHYQHMRVLCAKLPMEDDAYAKIRSNSVLGLGRAYMALGNDGRILEIGREYLTELCNLSTLTPYTQAEVAVAHDLIGNALVRSKNFEEALSHFTAAEEICRSCAEADPTQDWRPNLANIRRSIAGALQQLGRVDEAIGLFRSSIEIEMSLISNDTPDQKLARICNDLRQIAAAISERGPVDEAVDKLRTCIEWEKRRVASTPGSPEPALGLARSYQSLGRVLNRAADHEAAMVEFRKGVHALAGFVGGQISAQIAYEHAACLEGVGECLSELGRYDESLPVQRQVLEVRTALVDAFPDDTNYLVGRVFSLFNVAEMHAYLNEIEPAVAHARECGELIEYSRLRGIELAAALTEALQKLEDKIVRMRRTDS